MRTLLNLLPPSDGDNSKYATDEPLEASHHPSLPSPSLLDVLSQYSVTEVWSVPFVGTVVNGLINSGSVKVGDAVLYVAPVSIMFLVKGLSSMGPDANGNYLPTAIKSMQRKR
jgi:translation elongation factor EF-1alpha